MEIKYNVAGPERKKLAQVIAKELGIDAIYKGVPTCSYEMDYFTRYYFHGRYSSQPVILIFLLILKLQ